MLFAVKRRAAPALLCAAGVAGVAFGAALLLEIRWAPAPPSSFARDAALGFAAVAASDGLIHFLLTGILGAAYRARWVELALAFRGQTAAAALSGGLLAAAEELLFRGVILAGLLQAGAGAAASLAVSALLFGAMNVYPSRRLRLPFGPWAVWEGALLGGVYLCSGSLLVSAAVHAAHDVAGFAAFALARRRGTFDPPVFAP